MTTAPWSAIGRGHAPHRTAVLTSGRSAFPHSVAPGTADWTGGVKGSAYAPERGGTALRQCRQMPRPHQECCGGCGGLAGLGGLVIACRDAAPLPEISASHRRPGPGGTRAICRPVPRHHGAPGPMPLTVGGDSPHPTARPVAPGRRHADPLRVTVGAVPARVRPSGCGGPLCSSSSVRAASARGSIFYGGRETVWSCQR